MEGFCMRRKIALVLAALMAASAINMPINTVKVNASGIDKVKEAASSAGNAAKDKLNSAGNTAKDKLKEAGNATKEAAENTGKKAQEAAESAGKKAKEAGKATKEAAGKAKEKASSAYDSASAAAKEAGTNIKNYVASIDTEKFESGWDYAAKYVGVTIASLKGNSYVNSVQDSITTLHDNMIKEVNTKRTIASDAGFAAEEWATDTFNIDAALNDSSFSASRPKSNKPNSSDVVVSDGKSSTDYSFKYYKNADESAKEQARTFLEDYREYCSKTEKKGGTPISEEEYLAQYGKPLDALYDSVYSGQGRIIPSDQLPKAKEYLKNHKAKLQNSESTTRQALAPAMQETLDKLADRIEAPDGTHSRPLSEDEAKAIVQLCRDGDFDLADFGISPSQLITTRYILKQSLDAGTQSAIISTAFAIGPDIYSIIVDAAKEGKIDEKALKEVGIEGVLAGTGGFVEGSVSSAIVIACQSGKFGPAYTNIAPETVGTLTVLTIDAIRFGYQLSQGQITEEEYADLMTQDIFIAIASQASGTLLQMLFPFIPFAYMAGSMAGAMVASVGYEAGKELILEVRGQNGFETVVPETLSSGKELATSLMSNIKFKDKISDFKGMAVSTIGNGKIKIQDKKG